MHARTQAMEPSSRQSGSPGRVGCLGLRAQPGPELPIPLPELTGEGSESSPLWRRGRPAGHASAKGPREGRSLVQVTQGQSWGEPGQPYLVHQQLGIGLDRDADHVGAVDGLPVRRVTKLSDGGVGSGSWTLWQGRSTPLHSRGDRGQGRQETASRPCPGVQGRGPAPRQPPPHSAVLQAEASAGAAEVVTGAAVVQQAAGAERGLSGQQGLSSVPLLLAHLCHPSPGRMRPALTLGLKEVNVSVAQLCPTLCHPVDGSPPGSSVQYWSGLPYPPPGDLPDPGVEPRCPAVQADSLLSEHQGSPHFPLLSL